MNDVERERRMVAAKGAKEAHFYHMELAPGFTIDGRSKGNVARLINTSCSPNCTTEKWSDAATGVYQYCFGPVLLSVLLCV